MDIDVLLPFHRIDAYLYQALESISDSVEIDVRLILIDDRIDQSNEISDLLNTFRKIEYVRTQGGKGYAAALEVGTPYIATDFIALFNSDDLVHPRRFVNQVRNLENSEISITAMKRIDDKGKSTSSFMGHLGCDTFDPIFLLLGAYGANATWCMRKEWWEKNAFFDDEECLDWRIALRSFRNSEIHFSPEELYFYRKHARQKTQQKEIAPEKMWPVFLAWEQLWNSYDLPPVSYEAFNFLATPWNAKISYSPLRINEIADSLHAGAKSLPKDVFDEVSSLLEQRYLFALNSQSSLMSSLQFLRRGIPGIPRLLKTIYS